MMSLFSRFLILFIAVSAAALAQIPRIMSYQGVLADTSGNAVADGNYNLTFKIYDVASGGTEIWMETQSIPVVDGIFNAILGSATSLNLAFDQPYWLGVSVDGGTELSPRIELTSVPYSLEPDSGSGGDGHSLDAADGDPEDAVFVDNDGKVGIGTINPNEKLVIGDSTDAINQNMRIRSQHDVALMLEADTDNASEDDNPYISFLQDGSIVEGIVGMSGGAGVGPDGSPMTDVGANSLVLANKFAGARIQFMTNNGTDVGNRMTINGDGQVGIGTLIPNSNTKLHVESNDFYAGYFTSDRALINTHVIHAEFVGDAGQSAPVAVYGDANDGFGLGGVFSGGDVGVFGYSGHYAGYFNGDLLYTGNLIGPSDAKLKENVRPLTGSLNKLMRLKPKTFNFASDEQYAHMNLPAGKHYGLVAQEVEQVFPELVSDNTDPSASAIRAEKSDDPPISYKGLYSMEFIPLLIEAAKEQQIIIERLQEQNQKQQQEINQLKIRN